MRSVEDNEREIFISRYHCHWKFMVWILKNTPIGREMSVLDSISTTLKNTRLAASDANHPWAELHIIIVPLVIFVFRSMSKICVCARAHENKVWGWFQVLIKPKINYKGSNGAKVVCSVAMSILKCNDIVSVMKWKSQKEKSTS